MVIDARHRLATVRKLPYDAEIEFLESTGTQWIDTEVKLATTSSARVTLDFYHLGSSQRNIFGSNDSEGFNCYLQTQTTIGFYLCGGYVRQSVPLSVNERHSLDWNVASTGEGSVILDGITYTTSARTLKQSTVNFYLYAQIPLKSRTSKLKIYNCQIYVSDVLIRNFIPVRIGTTGYMYDRANPNGGPLGNGLYPNQGAGDFTLGKDVAYPKRKFEITYRKPFVSITPPITLPRTTSKMD